MTVFLHGFWGQPKDWNPVLEGLPLSELAWAPDLFEPGPLSPNWSLPKWTENFLEQVRVEAGETPVQLVGYSMGARLALNALVRAPQMFSRALLLSGAPFAPSNGDERLEWENQWTERFLRDDWEKLEREWQEQPVLSASSTSPRRHSPALREMLGLSLRNWSPRLHTFAAEDVKALPATVDWAFGALDQKYVGVAKALQDLPVKGQITIIPNAGHRLVTDASAFISGWVAKG